MILVEGIGGTGKAVVNLLNFVQSIARAVEISPPNFDYLVVDQDPDGVWPGVAVSQPVPGVTGTLVDAMNLSDPQMRAAATLFFSDEELRIDLSRGFHGRPKLLAEIQKLASTAAPRGDVHVIVYSDIGGTGAGFGPVRLRQAINTPGKRHVIAYVLGKYLNKGTENPLGDKILSSICRECGSQGPFVTVHHVSATPVQTDRQGPPASGLNPAPVLAGVTRAVWNLGLDLDRLDDRLEVAGRASGRGIYKPVSSSDPSLRLDGPDSRDFVTRVATAARRDDLSKLTGDRTYFFPRLQQEIASDALRGEAWRVLSRPFSSAPSPAPQADLGGAFNEFFAGGPDVMATAHWFHRAVAEGIPFCQDAFRKLIYLYLSGQLYVLPLSWPTAPRGKVFALSLEQLDATDANLERSISGKIVGAFAVNYPFWTTPRFLPSLNLLTVPTENTSVNVWLKKSSSVERCYESRLPLVINADPNVRLTTNIESRPSLAPSSMDWVVNLSCADWNGLRSAIAQHRLLKTRLGVEQLRWTTGDKTPYIVSADGLTLALQILPSEDGLFVGSEKGITLCELSVNGSAERRIASQSGQPMTPGRDTKLSVLLGNVQVTVD